MTIVNQWTAHQLGLAIGYMFPVYKSSQALRRQDKHELLQWIAFWTVNAIFWAVEMVGDTVIGWVPFYVEAKVALLCWLVLPQYRGAHVLLTKWLAPTFEKHEDVIDDAIMDMKRRASEKVVQVCKDTAVLALRRGSGVMAQGQQYVAAQLVQQALGKLQQSPPSSENQELRVPAVLSFLATSALASTEAPAPRKSIAPPPKLEQKESHLEIIAEEKERTKSIASSKDSDTDAKGSEPVPTNNAIPSPKASSPKRPPPPPKATAPAVPAPQAKSNQEKSKELVAHFKKLLVKGFHLKYYPTEGVVKNRTLRLQNAQSRYLVFESTSNDTATNKKLVTLFIHNVRRVAATKAGESGIHTTVDDNLAFVLDNAKSTLLFEADSTKTRDLLVAGMRLLVNERKRQDTIAVTTITAALEKLLKQRAFDRWVCTPAEKKQDQDDTL